MSRVFVNTDLSLLEESAPLSRKLVMLFKTLKVHFDLLDHISVTVYDSANDTIKTFLDTDPENAPLSNYQVKLSETDSLREIVETGKARVINDMTVFEKKGQIHTQKLLAAGFRSSYTLPMFYNSKLYGFIFFNSRQVNCFTNHLLSHLDPFSRLLTLVVLYELRSVHTLTAAVQSTRYVVSKRDCETGDHLERMSRYSRIIARHLAEKLQLTDEYIEYLFLFAPLHDIGKIAIPDHVLLKPERLTNEEFEIMKGHAEKGLDIVDEMLKGFSLTELPYIGMLRSIVFSHHEAIDGSGYPRGLKGDEIPFEARSTTTADIFDALTSRRPYKPAWSNIDAVSELRRLAETKLDDECVEALVSHMPEIEAIQNQFQENHYG
jgi:HD-GYP domain-containing protein (c-di-GMP phosphodiesterase class II)